MIAKHPLLKIILFQIILCFALPNNSHAANVQISGFCQMQTPGFWDSATAGANTIANAKISQNIVECMNYAMENIADNYYPNLITFSRKLVSAVVILSIFFFAVKTTLRPATIDKGKFFIYIMKLVIIFGLALNADFLLAWRNALLSASAGMGQIISGVLNGPGAPTTTLWQNLDMSVLRILGIRPGHGYGTTFLLFAIMIGLLMAGGPAGLKVVVIGLTVIITMFIAVVQCIFIYITSLIAITFLLGLAPLIVPLILFKKTVRITKAWFNHLVVYTVSPVIMTAFMVMFFKVLEMPLDVAQRLYNNAHCVIIESQDPANCPPLIEKVAAEDAAVTIPETKLDLENNPELKKQADEALARGAELQHSRESYWSYISSLPSNVAEYVKNKLKEAAMNLISAVINIPILKWGMGIILQFIIIQSALVSLLLLMLNFMKKLPQHVENFVSKDSVSSANAQGSKWLEDKSKDKIGKALDYAGKG